MWQSFRFHSITQVKYSILPIYCTVFKFQVFLLFRFKFLLFSPTKTGKVGRRTEKVKGGSKITLTSSWSKQDCKSHLLSSKSRLVLSYLSYITQQSRRVRPTFYYSKLVEFMGEAATTILASPYLVFGGKFDVQDLLFHFSHASTPYVVKTSLYPLLKVILTLRKIWINAE